MFAVALVRAGETVEHLPRKISSIRVSKASLACETNPAFALCSCETEEKSMQGNWLKTSSPGKVTDSSRYSVLCCSFPDQNLLRWHYRIYPPTLPIDQGGFCFVCCVLYLPYFSHSSDVPGTCRAKWKATCADFSFTKRIAYESSSLLAVTYRSGRLLLLFLTMAHANSHVVYAHTRA